MVYFNTRDINSIFSPKENQGCKCTDRRAESNVFRIYTPCMFVPAVVYKTPKKGFYVLLSISWYIMGFYV